MSGTNPTKNSGWFCLQFFSIFSGLLIHFNLKVKKNYAIFCELFSAWEITSLVLSLWWGETLVLWLPLSCLRSPCLTHQALHHQLELWLRLWLVILMTEWPRCPSLQLLACCFLLLLVWYIAYDFCPEDQNLLVISTLCIIISWHHQQKHLKVHIPHQIWSWRIIMKGNAALHLALNGQNFKQVSKHYVQPKDYKDL